MILEFLNRRALLDFPDEAADDDMNSNMQQNTILLINQ